MADRRQRSRDVTGGTKPVDFAYLGRFTFADRELEREVLYLFAQSIQGYVAALAAADDDKAWQRAAHTIKGSARAVGAWRVARMAETAERIGFSTNPDRRRHAIDLISEAADEATGFIVRVFPET
jgi:HPt (histidine-containing phosphotransfer) domain-containing protein